MTISKFTEEYEFVFDDGRTYTPNEQEKAMIGDALCSFLTEHRANICRIAQEIYETNPIKDDAGWRRAGELFKISNAMNE